MIYQGSKFWLEKLLFFSSVLVFFSTVNAESRYSYDAKYKVCTDTSPSDECSQLARDQNLACHSVRSKVDCIINADLGLPHVTTLTAEEALLGAALVSDSVVVIGEIIRPHPPYQTVVLVRSTFAGGFDNLRGLRYCHPGFKHDELVTRYVLEQLESKIVGVNLNCSDNVTTAERKVRSVSAFFGSSCRPGQWTDDLVVDERLKTAYPSLCSNCGASQCNIAYTAPFNDTIYSCLLGNGGDLALTSLRDAQYFFNNSESASSFQYLCPDGSVSGSDAPCTWTNQLRRVIVTSSAVASDMSAYISAKLSTQTYSDSDFVPQSASTDVVSASLATILNIGRRETINYTQPIPLRQFVQARRQIPSVDESLICNATVRWSTRNETEQQKCLWLRQAGVNYGLQPIVQCVRNTDDDVLSSLDDIKNGYADITFVDANYGYTALKKGLTNVAYPETDSRQVSRILIVTNSDNQNITSLNDLKGLRSCFPEYGGKEWLAFVDTLRDQNVLPNSCDYGKIFSEFVGQSCVPGARSSDYDIPNSDQEKLCFNCIPVDNTATATYCNADGFNKYFGTNGVLRCLNEKAGDYGVITRHDITENFNASAFRIIARNGSLGAYTGFDVDENAPLTIITAGEVVIKKDSPKFADAEQLLQSIEYEFGQNLHKPFKVFEVFNATADLLFPDSTPGLSFGDTKIRYVENFQKLLRTSEQCVSETSSAFRSYPVIFTVFVTLMFGLFVQ